MNKLINWDKPIECKTTYNNKWNKAVLLSKEGIVIYPYTVKFVHSNGVEDIIALNEFGICRHSILPLVRNFLVKKTAWVNINSSHIPGGAIGGLVYSSKEAADKSSLNNRIACVEVEYEE